MEAAILDYRKRELSSFKLSALFIICFIASSVGGTVSTLMSVYLPAVANELRGSASTEKLNYISGYINSLFIFGWAVGGFFCGTISDRIGRKTSLLLAVMLYGAFTLLTAFMPSWPSLMLCRFMSGFGVGGVLVISFTFLSEVWPEKTKPIFTGILSIAFPIGIFSAGAINYFVDSWRESFLIGVVPMLLAPAGYRLIDESQKWLVHKTCTNQEANQQKPLFDKENRKPLLTGALVFGTMLIGLWAIFSWLPSWIQSLTLVDAPKERGLSMMVLGIGGLTGGFFSGWLVKIAGLRNSMITCFAVCSILSFILFKTNSSFNTIIYLEIAVLALFFGISQGILSVYIPHLFPTAIRASATGFCFNAGRLFTAIAVLFVGVLLVSLKGYGNALFIFSLVFFLGLITVLAVKNIQVGSH